MKNKPPYDATVKNMRVICYNCRDVSNATHKELQEKVEDLSGTTFDRNLEAAIMLGLFEKNEKNKIHPTVLGKKIGYGSEDQAEEEEVFRKIISESGFYRKLLLIVGDDLNNKGEDHYLTRDDVMKEMGIYFDFDAGDRILESAASTFLRVLDAASLGKYKQGRSGYPTRFVITNNYVEFLERIVEIERIKQESLHNSEYDHIDRHIDQDIELNIGDIYSKIEDINDIITDDSTKTEVTEDSEKNREEVISVNGSENNSTKTRIHIEISSSDWESTEVIELLEAIRSDSD